MLFRSHHAVDRSSFTARLHAGRGRPGHAPPIRDHGPTAAGRGGAAFSQPVQGTERLESPPSIDPAGSGSPSPVGENPPPSLKNRRRKLGVLRGFPLCSGAVSGIWGGKDASGIERSNIFVPERPIRSREVRPLRPSPAAQFQPVLFSRMLSRSDRG